MTILDQVLRLVAIKKQVQLQSCTTGDNHSRYLQWWYHIPVLVVPPQQTANYGSFELLQLYGYCTSIWCSEWLWMMKRSRHHRSGDRVEWKRRWRMNKNRSRVRRYVTMLWSPLWFLFIDSRFVSFNINYAQRPLFSRQAWFETFFQWWVLDSVLLLRLELNTHFWRCGGFAAGTELAGVEKRFWTSNLSNGTSTVVATELYLDDSQRRHLLQYCTETKFVTLQTFIEGHFRQALCSRKGTEWCGSGDTILQQHWSIQVRWSAAQRGMWIQCVPQASKKWSWSLAHSQASHLWQEEVPWTVHVSGDSVFDSVHAPRNSSIKQPFGIWSDAWSNWVLW